MFKYKATMYVRLSNSDDLKSNEESNSIINQKRLIESYVNECSDIEIVSEKVDDGYSGIVFDRPAFNEMIEEIKKGYVNCVIVKDLSRFGREYIETGRYLQKIFPSYGVRFIAINDNIDTIRENNGNDSLITSIKTIFNDSYCKDISDKTKSALNIKRANGDFVGATTKYGYLKSKENKNKLVIDEYAASIVKDIYAMKVNGLSSLNIANKLNEQGILSPIEYKKKMGITYSKGGYGDRKGVVSKWTVPTIIRILSDEIYIGNMIQGKQTKINYKINKYIDKPKNEWIKVENTHEKIIEKKQFDLVQRLMLLDTRTSPNKDKLHLFSGLLICGDCGYRMTRKTVRSRGKSYIYYNCPITKKEGCNSEMIREDKLISSVLNSIKAQIDSVISIEKILSELDDDLVNENKITKIKESIKINNDKIENIKSYKSSLYENMINGVLSKKEYKLFKENYNSELKQLKSSIEILNREIELILKGENNKWISYFKDFSNFNNLDRKVVVSLINTIVVENKNLIKINFNFKQEYENKLKDIESICD